jgi:hypothetical protein
MADKTWQDYYHLKQNNMITVIKKLTDNQFARYSLNGAGNLIISVNACHLSEAELTA